MAQNPQRFFGTAANVVKPNSCFIMMPFGAPWSNDVWRAIYSSLGLDGIECIRADNMYGSIIIEDIYSGITGSRILIADATEKNSNVFYEVGIAHALERDVLFLIQTTEEIIFDVNRFRHIVYSRDAEGLNVLGGKLRKFARELVSPGERRPYSLAITPAGPDVDARFAGFLGQWEGVWTGSMRGSLSHTLVVEKVDGESAHITYFWGNSPEWNLRANSVRVIASLHDASLYIRFPDVKIRYWIEGNTLRAERFDRKGTFYCTLFKVR